MLSANLSYPRRNKAFVATITSFLEQYDNTGDTREKIHSLLGKITQCDKTALVRPTDPDFKLRSLHHSFYARMIACSMPHLRHWFKFKRCKADNVMFYEFLKKATGIDDPVAILFGEK